MGSSSCHRRDSFVCQCHMLGSMITTTIRCEKANSKTLGLSHNKRKMNSCAYEAEAKREAGGYLRSSVKGWLLQTQHSSIFVREADDDFLRLMIDVSTKPNRSPISSSAGKSQISSIIICSQLNRIIILASVRCPRFPLLFVRSCR